MAGLNPDLKIVMAAPEAVEFSMPSNVEVHVIPEVFPGNAGMRKTYWEQRQLPKFFKKQQVDLVHFPYPANPWNGFEKPVAVTVHDTIPWESAAYRRSVTTRLYQDSCRFAVKKADHVFAVSEASRADIVRMCKVPADKISLTSNAPAPLFSQKFSQEARNAVLKRYGMDPSRKFLLYVGGYDERKNVATLVRVFRHSIAPFYDVDLVLAGGKSLEDPLYASFDLLTNKMPGGSLGLQRGKMVPTGFVAEDDLPALYQSAFVFVHLSEKEGCNLPLLEAAVSGTPILASDIPVHHEMVGRHVAFTPAHDEKAIAASLVRFLTDENFYSNQKQKVSNYVCPFLWTKTATEVLNVYKKLLS
jgi:glycosyltransferase involved in cell wall biosynthesis